jgi:beta-ureidopropionase
MKRKIRACNMTLPAEKNASMAGNYDRARDMLELAGKQGVDIAVLPELYALIGLEGEIGPATAEPLDGPSVSLASQYARRYGMYVISAFLERTANEAIYNSAALLDRQGDLIGVYHKIYPAWPEFSATPDGGPYGVSIGQQADVFDTDFGRIGIQICFDSMFPTGWRRLRQQGAKVIFFSSLFPAGKRLQARASDYNCYVVASTWQYPSLVVDITGDIISETGPFSPLAVHELDLDRDVFDGDFQLAKIKHALEKYQGLLSGTWHPREGWIVLEAHGDDLTVAQVAEEYGLEPAWRYIERSRVEIDRMRAERLNSTKG